MKPISIWAANTQAELPQLEPVAFVKSKTLQIAAYLTSDSLWLLYTWPDKSIVGFRAAFSPSGNLEIKNAKQTDEGYSVNLECSTLKYSVLIQFPDGQGNIFRYMTTVTPKIDLLFPFWPKDILSFQKNGKIREDGEVHTQQVGTRSGVLFFNDGSAGSVFYFQNLTALNDYCQATETSAGDLVGGSWPEIGFSLAPATKPLKKGKAFTLSDAFVNISLERPKKPAEICTQYLDQLAEIYVLIPRPERFYHNWLETVEKGLNDLVHHKGCWTYGGGHSYLNAYVADYHTPPEIMVQLAVLLPMVEYLEWKGEKDHQLITELKAGLPSFYEEDMKTIVRWLPALQELLDYSEEQKQPRVMDAWYLHHPMMNLARLAEKGDKEARKLLLDSADYIIRVAHEFNYQWPVFYQMDTLKILKAETAEGKGGEKDVPGTYADVMLRLWKITGEQNYFKEAVKATKILEDLTFDIFYQANNTAFAAGALLRLYKETKEQSYLDLSYICLAAIFNNVHLWECNYGHAKNYATFFSIFPLKDAPYTAAYEEQEVYAALHDYLLEAEGVDLRPSIRLLIAEFIRHMVGRVAYYYPPLLPKEMLVEESKTGEIDPSLWIALEDLQDGWIPSGEVGQEVYGAGIAFGVIPRQYYRVPNESFILFCDYPIRQIRKSKHNIQLSINGDSALNCRVILLLDKNKQDYQFKISTGMGKRRLSIEPLKKEEGFLEYSASGGQILQINW